jgi:hypothetical protein
MKKSLIGIIIIVVAVGSGAFYAGMKYRESKAPGGFATGNLRNLSAEERQQKLQGLGAPLRQGFEGQANVVTGEIIAKDDKSVTIKLRDGGSKIVFFSDSTEITKSTAGSPADFAIGKTVIVGGKQNPDGSFTAGTAQLR